MTEKAPVTATASTATAQSGTVKGSMMSKQARCVAIHMYMYRDRLKGVQILLSNSQAGPGRKVKQEQEEISRNHVQAF